MPWHTRRRARLSDPAGWLGHARHPAWLSAASGKAFHVSRRSGSSGRSRTPSAGSRASRGPPRRTCSPAADHEHRVRRRADLPCPSPSLPDGLVPIRWLDKRGSRMRASARLAIAVAWDLFRIRWSTEGFVGARRNALMASARAGAARSSRAADPRARHVRCRRCQHGCGRWRHARLRLSGLCRGSGTIASGRAAL